VGGGISRRWAFVAGETPLRRRNPVYPATLYFVEMIFAVPKSTDGGSKLTEKSERGRNFPYHSIAFHWILLVVYLESFLFDALRCGRSIEGVAFGIQLMNCFQWPNTPSTGRSSLRNNISQMLSPTNEYPHRQLKLLKLHPVAAEGLDCISVASCILSDIQKRSSVESVGEGRAPL
jgi:hypothetical protein